MKDEFVSYLKTIGMTEPLLERVKSIHDFYEAIFPNEITSVFVSEYVNQDGSRQYESLWFFSLKYTMEAKQFTTTDNFDVAPIHKQIRHWLVEKQEYDFKEATTTSRFTLTFLTRDDVIGTLKASGTNCDQLRDVVAKYMIPNLLE